MMFSRPVPKSTTLRTRPRRDVVEDLAADLDLEALLAFGTVSETRIVSPMPRPTSCSNAMRVLITPSGGMPAFGDAEVQRHVGALGGEAAG